MSRFTAAQGRITALDVVRGVALSGILFVNAPPVLRLTGAFVGGEPTPVRFGLDMLVQQRFFPVFSLLFGIGFGLLWNSAQARAARPRLVMLRRILALGALGAVHQLLQPGEALLPYALAALVILLPVTWVPKGAVWQRITIGSGVLAVAAGLSVGGGLALIPGLFLLGFGLAEADVARRLFASPRALAAMTAVAAVVALPLAWLQANNAAQAGFDAVSAVAGSAQAVFYVGVVGLLLHTPLAKGMVAVFSPLGRAALTNYVSATLILVAVRELPLPGGSVFELLGFASGNTGSWVRMLLLCAAILAVQAAVSRVWLTAHGQGPLESVWRKITWAGRPERHLVGPEPSDREDRYCVARGR